MVATEKMKKRKSLVGQVVSDRMDKTIIVKVTRTFIEQRLNKVMRIAKKYKVHDEGEVAHIGDIVEIYEGKPKSKTKYMYLDKVLRAS